MEQQYLIDSNAVIDYLGSKFTDSGMIFMNNIINSSLIEIIFSRNKYIAILNSEFYWIKSYENNLIANIY